MSVYDINGVEVNISAKDDIIKRITASKYHFNTTDGLDIWTTYNNYDVFTLAHISDLHNDATRYDNFMQFVSDYDVDAGIVTGDLIDTSTASAFAEMTAKETHNIDLLKVIGNHEKSGNSPLTDAQIYNNWNLITNTEKIYYYKDYPSYNIRVICIDAYDLGVGDSHYSQTQINWFIEALKGAKTAGYTVIVARHNVEGGYHNLTPNNNGFFQRWYQWADIGSIYNNGTIIEDIVDAFKTGSSISGTYTFTDSTPSITVNTTFSGNGSFACYVSGHYHGDFIGYSVAHPNQLYLNIAQGCLKSSIRPSVMWEQVSDLPRKEGEPSENLFNVYGFDIKNHQIKVMRVGSDVNDKMEKREMAVYTF